MLQTYYLLVDLVSIAVELEVPYKIKIINQGFWININSYRIKHLILSYLGLSESLK